MKNAGVNRPAEHGSSSLHLSAISQSELNITPDTTTNGLQDFFSTMNLKQFTGVFLICSVGRILADRRSFTSSTFSFSNL
jgi:hypothetical protein